MIQVIPIPDTDYMKLRDELRKLAARKLLQCYPTLTKLYLELEGVKAW